MGIYNRDQPFQSCNGIYFCTLDQSGAGNAPVATLYENTIGAAVWSYNGIGDYRLTLTPATGKFVINKCPCFVGTETDRLTGTTFMIMLYGL